MSYSFVELYCSYAVAFWAGIASSVLLLVYYFFVFVFIPTMMGGFYLFVVSILIKESQRDKQLYRPNGSSYYYKPELMGRPSLAERKRGRP